MKSLSKNFAFGLIPIVIALNGCGPLSSKSSAERTSPPPPVAQEEKKAPTDASTTNEQSPIPTAPAPATPICAANQKAIGANITFLIDNSSSNANTDCPSAQLVGQYAGTNTYRCGAETNREKAVLAAFDLLADVATRDRSSLASSNISVVGFPASNNDVRSVQIATNGWLSTSAAVESKKSIQSALQFTRAPLGATPYGTAVLAARGLFSTNTNDGRPRVAVLVTDGIPTDRDPTDVAARAKELQQIGVEVITVLITNAQSRVERERVATQDLQAWNQQKPNYFNSQRYQSFEAYLDDLLGRKGKVSLTDQVTSKVVPSCVDGNGTVCQRWKVEINSASELPNVVKQIVRNRAVKCI